MALQNEASARLTSAAEPIAVARPRLPAAEAVLPYLRAIDATRWYSNFGPLLTAFEQRLAARFPDGAEIVTMSSATQGLTLALKAMELPAGALCALPSWTFVATAHAVAQAGLVPWFVDVDEESWMLDPASVKAALARAPGPVAAVVPVSAFGRRLDLAAWRPFREETGLAVLVDAAAGFDTADDAVLPVVVSLHATKVLGVGEGGYLATRDADLARRARQLGNYAFQGSRDSQFPATNAKLSEYPAAVGMAALDGWAANRLRFALAAQHLRIALAAAPEVEFQPGWGLDWVTSVCVVRLPENSASRVERALGEAGIHTRRWWGEGCHRSPAFAGFPRDRLEVTERLAARTLGLPFAIDLSADDAGRIAAALASALGA